MIHRREIKRRRDDGVIAETLFCADPYFLLPACPFFIVAAQLVMRRT